MTDPSDEKPGASFSDIASFMQKVWNPFGVPIPGFGVPGIPATGPGAAPPVPTMPGGLPFPNPAAMFATLDPTELARKIDEMKVIEGWLQMSLNFVQLSIKTMELQKASLEALRAGSTPGSEKSSGPRRA